MTIWINAQISPELARWLLGRFVVEAVHLKDLQATDPTIFDAARIADAVVLTKDRDFVDPVRRRGIPPRVIWITCGNTSTHEQMRILDATFHQAWDLLVSGEPIVEIKGQRLLSSPHEFTELPSLPAEVVMQIGAAPAASATNALPGLCVETVKIAYYFARGWIQAKRTAVPHAKARPQAPLAIFRNEPEYCACLLHYSAFPGRVD